VTPPITGRVSLITLAVSDVARATAFYSALGWEPSSASVAGEVTFFATQGALLGLWGRDALSADSGLPMEGRNAALAINLESREAVDAAFAGIAAAGGQIVRAAHATDWGGYSGYFADPDGNLWEVAHNPFWPIDDRGRPQLPTP
jgi:catechol 2,3-dioxygenase-like lactoylglutathione lyase family enzyme